MIRLKDLRHEQFRVLAGMVRTLRQSGFNDSQIIKEIQVSTEDIAYLDKFNSRTDSVVRLEMSVCPR